MAEAGEIQKMTQNELQLLQQSLQDLSSRAVGTTKIAIESQQLQISQLLMNYNIEMQSSTSQINRQLAQSLMLISENLQGPQNQVSESLDQVSKQIESQGQAINQMLASAAGHVKSKMEQSKKAINQQQADLKTEMKKQTNRLLLLMKIPLILIATTVLMLCLGAFALTWAYLPTQLFKAQTIVKSYGDQQYLLITDPGWTSCELVPGSRHPCKKIN